MSLSDVPRAKKTGARLVPPCKRTWVQFVYMVGSSAPAVHFPMTPIPTKRIQQQQLTEREKETNLKAKNERDRENVKTLH